MLSTHADAFFMTPMRLSIATQATRNAGGMPAPRPLSASATKIVHGNDRRLPFQADRPITRGSDQVIPHGMAVPARGVGHWRPAGGAIPLPGVAPGNRALKHARPVDLRLHGEGSMWNGMGMEMPSTNTMMAVGGVVAVGAFLFWFLRK